MYYPYVHDPSQMSVGYPTPMMMTNGSTSPPKEIHHTEPSKFYLNVDIDQVAAAAAVVVLF